MLPFVYREEHGRPQLRRHKGTGPDLKRGGQQDVAQVEEPLSEAVRRIAGMSGMPIISRTARPE